MNGTVPLAYGPGVRPCSAPSAFCRAGVALSFLPLCFTVRGNDIHPLLCCSAQDPQKRVAVPEFADLLEFAPGTGQDVLHADSSAVFGREKRGAEDDVLDVAATDLKVLR